MGKRANPAVIGAFVVGALALAVIGVLVFGSGRLFKHTLKFVCFFPGAVDGLNVGAPVRFKGVEVGSVTDIRLRLPEQAPASPEELLGGGIRIPVMVELDSEKIMSQGVRHPLDQPAQIKQLIELGLRAQLNSQSLVTGLLFVQLDLHPKVPPTFVLPPGSDLAEIPTIPTTLEQAQSAAKEIIAKLEQIHFDKLIDDATQAMDAINGLVNAPALRATIDALPDTVAKVNDAVVSIRQLAARLDTNQGPLIDSLKGTSKQADVAMEQARVTLQSVQALVDPNAPLAIQLTASLQEVAGAARALRLLADYLERNPSSIVRGKDTANK